MATKHDTSKQNNTGRETTGKRGAKTPPDAPKHAGRDQTQGASPGRTIESPGTPGLEKEPNRDKAVGPGGQRMTAGGKAAGREADVPGVDQPDGINAIDPSGETKAEDQKLL